ncbi:MAG: hypothetical protein IJH48_01590 [Oscillospiraceae bacterium]|nr:hypothetical protein [Oscillospiraceae bacterium]
MKKTLSSLLCILILCSLLLTGCGAGSPSGSKEYALKDQALKSDFICEDNNRVFYEIFVGSFSDSDGDGVGDLRGIINRMDYLNDGDPNSGRSLGVEGIWLSPIFKSPSYHKYDATDYYTIDPAFGTLDDLRELCELCHERNVKVIIDLAINHTGELCSWFGAFKLAHRNGDTANEYYDFYSWCSGRKNIPAGRTFSKIDGTDDYYECNFYSGMPELNFDNPAVRDEVIKIAKFYLDLGLDGFRFDAVKYVYFGDNAQSAEFWEWYADELRAMKSDIYMVGEVWDADAVIEQYYGALNCFNFTVSQGEGLIAKAAAGSGVGNYCTYVENYLDTVSAKRADATIVPFISNHDMDRAAGFLPVSNGRMQMAANIYLLGPGSPFLYYGEELGAKGSRGGSNTDANRRLAMPWGDDDTISDPVGADYPEKNRLKLTAAEELADQGSLYTYYKTLIMIRHANPEIARGEYSALDVSDGKLGGFVSVWEGKAVCVLHNAATEEKSVDLASLTDRGFSVIAASIGQGKASLDGTVLTLGPQTSVVLREG